MLARRFAFPVAAYVLGYPKFWEFRGPFDTIPIDCVGAIRPESEPQDLDDEEIKILADLSKVTEGVSATDNSSS